MTTCLNYMSSPSFLLPRLSAGETFTRIVTVFLFYANRKVGSRSIRRFAGAGGGVRARQVRQHLFGIPAADEHLPFPDRPFVMIRDDHVGLLRRVRHPVSHAAEERCQIHEADDVQIIPHHGDSPCAGHMFLAVQSEVQPYDFPLLQIQREQTGKRAVDIEAESGFHRFGFEHRAAVLLAPDHETRRTKHVVKMAAGGKDVVRKDDIADGRVQLPESI